MYSVTLQLSGKISGKDDMRLGRVDVLKRRGIKQTNRVWKGGVVIK